MISTSDFIHLPYTRDLTEGGIAYAVRSLPYTYNRMGGSPYDRMRRIVAGVAVELAFRRYLGEQQVPFDVKGATPFTEPDRYDVSLGGRRCDIKSFLITYREQISEMRRNPQVVLNAPALVPSDQDAAEGNLESDMYLFAFLSGLVAVSPADWKKVVEAGQPHYFIHAMPEAWVRPAKWNPLGALVLKSDSEESQVIEIGGQDAGREMRSLRVEIPAQRRIQIDEGFFSLAYIHTRNLPQARIGIHSPRRKATYIVNPIDWGNIWVYGMDILLTGYLTRQEFRQQARFLREGVRVFQYERTRTKNLAVDICNLKPLAELFERAKEWSDEGESRF
jgi:hypothetical protein